MDLFGKGLATRTKCGMGKIYIYIYIYQHGHGSDKYAPVVVPTGGGDVF